MVMDAMESSAREKRITINRKVIFLIGCKAVRYVKNAKTQEINKLSTRFVIG